MPHPDTRVPSSRLLRLLARVVACDRGPSRFTGRLTIGVRRGCIAEWLQITVLTTALAESVEFPDPKSDAIMLLDFEDAECLVERGDLAAGAPALSRLYGSRALLKRFIARYLSTRSLLSVRAATTRSQGDSHAASARSTHSHR